MKTAPANELCGIQAISLKLQKGSRRTHLKSREIVLSYTYSRHGNILLLPGLKLVCFSNHCRRGSKIFLCVQTPGHGGQCEVGDKSHFYTACRFLLLLAVFSERRGCRCGEFECTCDLLVAGKHFQKSFAVAQTVVDDKGVGKMILFYQQLLSSR